MAVKTCRTSSLGRFGPFAKRFHSSAERTGDGDIAAGSFGRAALSSADLTSSIDGTGGKPPLGSMSLTNDDFERLKP